MQLGERVAVYCENRTEHTNTLCVHNVRFLFVKAGGTYTNHWAIYGRTSLGTIVLGCYTKYVIFVIMEYDRISLYLGPYVAHCTSP
jgi:hypothetical protein